MIDQTEERTDLDQTNSTSLGSDTSPGQPSPASSPQQHPDGLIQKVEGVVEQAVEGAIQKATDVVDGAIDNVADAAKRVLGGDTSSGTRTPGE